MSETPKSTANSSPQKRLNEESDANDSKRPKLTTDGSNMSSFDINDLEIPKSTGDSSSPLKVDIPLMPTSQTSAPVSSINTPGQFNLELPELPGDSPSMSNSIETPNGTTGLSLPIQNQNQSQSQGQFQPIAGNSTAGTPIPLSNTYPNTPGASVQGVNDDTEITKPTAPADPDKLSDALLSAGVDLKAEEALLTSTTVNNEQDLSNLPQQPVILNTPFLDPRQLGAFMAKVANANGVKQSFENEHLITQLMTYACEEWMTNILTNAIILSRHRRRAIKQRKRSELSKALRDLAVNSKAQEEKRIQKRKNLGIDQDDQGKLGTEETQHKATNATVAMMTAGKKKKYSWMTGGGTAGGSQKTSQSSADGGIRFREAREEPGIAVRDLLSSLEKKRMGVEKVLTKGYSKLKD